MNDISCFLDYAAKPDNIIVAVIAISLVAGAIFSYRRAKAYNTKINMFYIIFGAIPFAMIFITLNTSCLCGEFCINNTLKLLSIGLFGAIVFLGIIYHFAGSRIYLRAIGGKFLKYNEAPDVYDAAKDVCSRIGIKMPRLAYIDSAEPIALSISGHTNIIAISVGALESLEKYELMAVLAHEASHIKSHDPLVKFMLNLMGISYLYGFMFTKDVEHEQEKRANEAAETVTSRNAIESAALKFKAGT